MLPHVAPLTHLIPKNSNGAGGGNLIWPEPDWGQFGGDPEDKDLSQGAGRLSEQGHPEQVRSCAGHLYPRPCAVERVGHQRSAPQSILLQQPGNREYEGDVREHVDHGQPVCSEAVHIVELHDDVADDSVLDPLVSVAQGISAEQEHNHPAPLVEARRERRAALPVWDVSLDPNIFTQIRTSLLGVLVAFHVLPYKMILNPKHQWKEVTLNRNKTGIAFETSRDSGQQNVQTKPGSSVAKSAKGELIRSQVVFTGPTCRTKSWINTEDFSENPFHSSQLLR